MTRIFRRDPDSSTLSHPRVFARVFCSPAEFAATVRFHEAVAEQALDQDIDLPEQGIRIAAVGGFLVVALDEHKMDPGRFRQATLTTATLVNPALDPAVARALRLGATLVGERFVVPHATGQRMTHPCGAIVEYLEHRPSRFDVADRFPLDA